MLGARQRKERPHFLDLSVQGRVWLSLNWLNPSSCGFSGDASERG
jgi:hypothetical protein